MRSTLSSTALSSGSLRNMNRTLENLPSLLIIILSSLSWFWDCRWGGVQQHILVIMGCTCVKKESEVDGVYKQLYQRIYQEVEKASGLKQISELKTNRFLYLKATVERKGVIPKLLGHLESHKNRISLCVSFMVGFGLNPLRVVPNEYVQRTNLIVLDGLIGSIAVLTQDHNFVKGKKSPMQVIEMSLRKPRTSTQYLEKDKKHVLLQSDSLAKAYELSLIKLFDFFRGCRLSEDEMRSYLSSMLNFSRYEMFKFDKQTVQTLLELCQTFFSGQELNQPEAFLCLQIFENLVQHAHHETELGVLTVVLKEVLLYRLDRQPESHSDVGKCVLRIIGLYEQLLLQSQNMRLYQVPLQIWESRPNCKSVVFELAFSNIMLHVLVKLLTDRTVRGRQMSTVDDIAPTYLNIAKFVRIGTASNRNELFSVLLDYIKLGYQTKKERLLLPLHELCLSLASNTEREVDSKAWLNSLIELLKGCEISLSLLFKQLLSTFEQLRLNGSDDMAISCLRLLSHLSGRESDSIQQNLDEDVYRSLSTKAFRLTTKLKLSQAILQVIAQVMAMSAFSQVSETYNYVVMVVAHDICRLLNQQYTAAYTEVMYACGLKVCSILESVRKHKINLFLALLQKVVEVYMDSHINTWFKCGYYAMIRKCTAGTNLLCQENNTTNQEVLADCKFLFSIQSKDTSVKLADKMKKFTRLPLSLNAQAMKTFDDYDERLFRKFGDVLSLTNIESDTVATIQSQEVHRVLTLRGRNSVQQETSRSLSNDQSLQEILNVLNKS